MENNYEEVVTTLLKKQPKVFQGGFGKTQQWFINKEFSIAISKNSSPCLCWHEEERNIDWRVGDYFHVIKKKHKELCEKLEKLGSSYSPEIWKNQGTLENWLIKIISIIKDN